MLKKALVAGVVVVVSLLTINYVFPNACSHARLWLKHRRERAQASVPLEQEIDRLKMEVKRLEEEDDRHYHDVAKQIVAVKKLDKEVVGLKARLDKDLALIRARKASLASAGEDRFVSYEGQKFDRSRFTDELRGLASRFKVEEEELQSKQEQLANRKAKLEASRVKLARLKLERQKLITRLEKLEARLDSEKQREALDSDTINDASYLKVAKDVEKAEERMSVNEEKRKLKSEAEGPVRAAEERKQKESEIDEFLKDPRFDDKADVTSRTGDKK